MTFLQRNLLVAFVTLAIFLSVGVVFKYFFGFPIGGMIPGAVLFYMVYLSQNRRKKE